MAQGIIHQVARLPSPSRKDLANIEGVVLSVILAAWNSVA